MAKLYTQRVLDCAGCPRLVYGHWCSMLHRRMYPMPQVPPPDCPLPDESADYPNLRMQAAGCVSGSLTEWPQLRAEARRALEEIARLRAQPPIEDQAITRRKERE